MSQIRKQLEAARREYQSVKYPGNLAGDLATDLPGDAVRVHHASSRMRIAVRSLSALAAVLVLAIFGWMSMQKKASTDIAVNPSDVTESEAADETLTISLATIETPNWGDVFASQPSEQASTQTMEATTDATSAATPQDVAVSWPTVPSFPTIDQFDESAASQSLDNQENE